MNTNIWTALDRNDFIKTAKESCFPKGSKGYFHFQKFPKSNDIDSEETPKKLLSNHITSVFSKVIYMSNPEYRKISLAFYSQLYYKLSMNLFIGPFMGSNVLLLLKGSNAYALLTNDTYSSDFPYSDLDIVIYINPFLEESIFNELQERIKILVIQTISQYKRMLDNTFFMKNENTNIPKIFDDNTRDQFIRDLDDEFSKIGPMIKSPFSNTETRNYCSKNSFIVTNDDFNQIVLVDVPHYDKCEKIPLKKTPIFCSYNDTIEFDRTNNGDIGNFDLYRIRLNVLHLDRDDNDNVREERLSIDFIDVGIASKNDSELMDFWKRGRCVSVFEKSINMWICLPDIYSAIDDLYKMVYIYKCPESKKEKRKSKLEKLKSLTTSIYSP